MRILVDENIPAITVRELRKTGHEVLDIRGSERQGSDDDELWALAQAEGRLLVTTDKGFASHRGEHHHGVLIVRLHQPTEQTIHSRVMLAMKRFPPHDWPGLLVVMRDTVQSVYRR
jgi:predicted nuclease of predicted toxin-antitoxin system